MLNEIDLHKALKKHFGFSKFKGLQEEVIKSVLRKDNTFVVMPTGGGKSLCYQLPALMQEGTAIIVSPLIALMKNQVDAIRGISTNQGIAHVLNSSLNKGQVKQVKSDIEEGITKLLYVAPESLTKEEYIDFLKQQVISFVAIDEAHCISEWGHDFRPEYRNLKTIIKRIDDVPVIGLTATATPKVQEDILKNLGITTANIFKASFNRPNLFYDVRPKTANVDKDIIRFVRQYKGKSGIIYCLSRKKVEEIAQVLQVNGIKALPYHAGLDSKTRARHQDMFLMEDTDVIVATIAFGMGIDKPDVRFVIHHDIPKSLESYYQETGRAGRDDGEGYCLAYYAYKDIEKLEKFMSGKPVAEQEIGHALLQEVVAYSETSMSRRKFLLHYFGEEFDEINGLGADMDDNTRNPKKKHEAKDEVVKISDDYQKIIRVFESLDQLSGLAYRRKFMGMPFHSDVFTCHIYPWAEIFKKHPIVFLKDFTVAVRIESSQSRSLASIYDKSPIQSWREMFDKVFYELELKQIKNYLIRNFVAKNYVGLVQIRNYAKYKYVWREIWLLLKYRWRNILNYQFWFFSLGTILTPRFILRPLADWYKEYINAKKIAKIKFDY